MSTKWADSRDVLHDLTTEKRLSTGEVAHRLTVTTRTIYQMIRRRELYPILRHNARRIEVYECAVSDYLARKLSASRNP